MSYHVKVSEGMTFVTLQLGQEFYSAEAETGPLARQKAANLALSRTNYSFTKLPENVKENRGPVTKGIIEF